MTSGREYRHRYYKKIYPGTVVLLLNKKFKLQTKERKYITYGRDKVIYEFLVKNDRLHFDKLHIDFVIIDNDSSVIVEKHYEDNNYYKYYKICRLNEVLLKIKKFNKNRVSL